MGKPGECYSHGKNVHYYGVVGGDGNCCENDRRKHKSGGKDSQTSLYFTPTSMHQLPKTSKHNRRHKKKVDVHIRKRRLEPMPSIKVNKLSNGYDPLGNLEKSPVMPLTDSSSLDDIEDQRVTRKYNPERSCSPSSGGRLGTLPHRVQEDKKECCNRKTIPSKSPTRECAHRRVYKPKTKPKSGRDTCEQTEFIPICNQQCQVSSKIPTIDTMLQTEEITRAEKECQSERSVHEDEERIIPIDECLQTEEEEDKYYTDNHWHEHRTCTQEHTFPFLGKSPSGNLKVPQHMVAYENSNIGILLANPTKTRLRHQEWSDNESQTIPPVPQCEDKCRQGFREQHKCKKNEERRYSGLIDKEKHNEKPYVDSKGCKMEYHQHSPRRHETIPKVTHPEASQKNDFTKVKAWSSSLKSNGAANKHSFPDVFLEAEKPHNEQSTPFRIQENKFNLNDNVMQKWTYPSTMDYKLEKFYNDQRKLHEAVGKPKYQSPPPKVPPFPVDHSSVIPTTAKMNHRLQKMDKDGEFSNDELMGNSHNNFDFMESLHYRIKRAIHPDTKVIIGNTEFPIHALALQVHSKYFDNLTRPPETVQKVELPESVVTPEDFRNIMDWILTDENDRKKIIHISNVVGLYAAAQYLGMSELKIQCLNYVKEKVASDDPKLIKLWEDAQNKPKTRELVSVISQKLTKLFPKLYKSGQFLKLDVDDLVILLDSDDVVIGSEMDIFDAAVRWLLYDWQKRKRYTAKIMSTVRFGLLTPLQLTQIPNLANDNYVPNFQKIFSLDSVKRMLQDGLTFAIFKQSYGKRSQSELTKWVNSSGITPPRPRIHLDPELLEEGHQHGLPETLTSLKEAAPFVDGIIKEGVQFIQLNASIEQKVVGLTGHSHNPAMSNTAENPQPHQDLEYQPAKESELSLQEIPYSLDPSRATLPSQESGEYMLAEQHKNEIKAAITIQRHVRGFLTRREILKEKHAATVIQGALRAYRTHTRNDYHPIKEPTGTKPLDSHPTTLSNSTAGPAGTYLRPDLKVPRDGLLVFGGSDPTQPISTIPSTNTGREIFMYLINSMTWLSVGALPEPRTHFGITRMGYEVYIIGGTDPRYKTSNERNIVVKSVWKVHLKTGEWYFDYENPSDLDSPRSHFGCATKDRAIYIFGGNDAEARALSTCRKYDVTFNTWTPIRDMDGPRVSMGVAVHEDHIWVAGGISKDRQKPVMKSVLCYDTLTNSWTAARSLPLPRAFPALVVAHGKLFILGGAGPRNKKSRKPVSVPEVLVLDPRSERWREIGVLNIARHGHCAVTIDHQIIVLGGVSSERMGAINSLEVFDLSTSHSQKGRSLHQNLSGMGVVSLQ